MRAKRKERLNDFYYGEAIMESDKEFFFYRKDLSIYWDPKKQNYAVLNDLRIGAIIGYNYGSLFTEAYLWKQKKMV